MFSRINHQLKLFCSVVSAAACLFGATTVNAQDPVELKVSLFTPPNAPLNIQMKSIKERLEKESNGRIVMNVFEASQMGPPDRQFDLVRTGVADVSIMFINIAPGRFPLLELAILPNLIKGNGSSDTSGQLASAIVEVRDDYLTDELAGVKLVNMAISPSQVVLAKNKIKKLDDLKNLRVRHSGELSAEVLEAFGAVPLSVRPPELAEALARGRIDGVLTTYSGVTSFKLHDSAKNSLEIPSGGLVFGIFMNADTYKNIPTDLQPLIDKYFGAAIQPEWSQLFIDNEVTAQKQLVDLGVSVRKLPDNELERAASIAAELTNKKVSEVEKSGKPARAYVEALEAAATN